MVKAISADRLETALQRLYGCCQSIFVDFLIFKYHGLTLETPLVITTGSTVEGCSSLLKIIRSDGKPPSHKQYYFNPMSHRWLHKGYPRSGTYTTVDRSNRFHPLVTTAIEGGGMRVALRPDYEPALQTVFRRKKRQPLAIPLADLAIWALRYEIFEDADTINNVTARFLERYHLTAGEQNQLFLPPTPDDDPFAGTPLDHDAFAEHLLARYGGDAERTDATETDTRAAAEEIPTDLVDFLRAELVLPSVTLVQLLTLVRSGKNIILTGPPGTGKTTLAVNLARAAAERADIFELPATSGWVLTTATADWSTFDTIGGYMPRHDGPGLRFSEGIFLRAIRENKWLIVDELNRADADKAFGQLFTVLSRQPVELPFQCGNATVHITFDSNATRSGFDETTATYSIGRNWRLIATMNTFDRHSLFQLSLAFVRRFATLHIEIPASDDLMDWIDEQNLSPDDTAKMKKLVHLVWRFRPLGPAILRDMADYLQHRVIIPAPGQVEERTGDAPVGGEAETAAPPARHEDPFFEVVVAYLLPQLDGLDADTLRQIRSELGVLLEPASREDCEHIFQELFAV